jgi:hypothetical protein
MLCNLLANFSIHASSFLMPSNAKNYILISQLFDFVDVVVLINLLNQSLLKK